MKQIYKYILSASALFAVTATVAAQGLNSGYFIDGFSYRHDLNPAFGNDQNYIAVPLAGNVNARMLGNFGLEDVLFDNPSYPSSSNKKKTTFMNPNISDALAGFQDQNKISGQVKIGILSAGFKGLGGYNTLELNMRANTDVKLPYTLFEFAKNTGNASYDIGQIGVRAQTFAELAFGHSHKFMDNKLSVGAKVKVLFGIMDGTFEFNNVKADLSGANQWTISGDAQANVSMKGFAFKSESKDYKVQTSGHQSYQRINEVDLDGVGIDGMGMAVDLGAAYAVTKDLTVSAALLDLGFISWNNNVLATNSSKSFVFGGFHDTGVTTEAGNTFDDQTDKYSDQIADFINLQDKGDQGSKSTSIGATVNIGAQYVLPVYRKVSFGLLGTMHTQSGYSWNEGRLSANYASMKWLDLGVNFAMGTFASSAGWILNIHPKGINFFVGMDCLMGKTSKEMIPLNSNAGISTGFNITF